MLQQILKDLYVDPEILSELDEQQKQTLFCKMREEQVRRWTIWDQSNVILKRDGEDGKGKKSVSFMQGVDGEPWVWVMGEHENDKSIEQILEAEAIEKARKLAEKEAEQLRKHVEAELKLTDYIDLTPKIKDLADNEKTIKLPDDIYCSVDSLSEKINNKTYTLGHYQNKNNKFNNMMIEQCNVLNEMNRNTQKVAHKVALWEKRLTEERTCEILQKMNKKRLEAAKEAEEAEIKHEQIWKEQERRAKEAEQQIREIARRARQEHRLTSCKLEIDSTYSTVAPGVPPGRQAVIDWYRTHEIGRNAGLVKCSSVEPWFHGLITRHEAESLLQEQEDGCYLVRLSERVWGYAISHKGKDKCKHYLITAGEHYTFSGNNQIKHKSLHELIEYHEKYPLSDGEKLLKPCPRNNNTAIDELFNQTTHI